jgi:hypothetical protein
MMDKKLDYGAEEIEIMTKRFYRVSIGAIDN